MVFGRTDWLTLCYLSFTVSENNKHFTLFPGALENGNLSELPRLPSSSKQKVTEPTKLKRKRISLPPKLPLKNQGYHFDLIYCKGRNCARNKMLLKMLR